MIHHLDLGFMGLEHAIAAFVVDTNMGLALVECGPASTLNKLDEQLAQYGWTRADISHVFLSHIHFDHAGAAWAFAEKGAQIHVHPKGLPHLEAPEKLYNSARMIYGAAMDELWGPMNPIEAGRLHAPAHGESITLGKYKFIAHYTPGHAVHHIAWQAVSETSNVLFTGDVAGVMVDGGPVMPPCPPPDIQVEDWIESIQRIRNLDVQKLYLTHFGVVDEKDSHLDALQSRLLEWAAWMRPHFDAGTPANEIIPLFEAYVRKTLEQHALDEATIKRYEAANPAFMSVNGLLRYWKKKTSV